jgi:hypothetical protein
VFGVQTLLALAVVVLVEAAVTVGHEDCFESPLLATDIVDVYFKGILSFPRFDRHHTQDGVCARTQFWRRNVFKKDGLLSAITRSDLGAGHGFAGMAVVATGAGAEPSA